MIMVEGGTCGGLPLVADIIIFLRSAPNPCISIVSTSSMMTCLTSVRDKCRCGVVTQFDGSQGWDLSDVMEQSPWGGDHDINLLAELRDRGRGVRRRRKRKSKGRQDRTLFFCLS